METNEASKTHTMEGERRDDSPSFLHMCERVSVEIRNHRNGSMSDYEVTWRLDCSDLQNLTGMGFTNREVASILDDLYRYGDAHEWFHGSYGQLIESAHYRLYAVPAERI